MITALGKNRRKQKMEKEVKAVVEEVEEVKEEIEEAVDVKEVVFEKEEVEPKPKPKKKPTPKKKPVREKAPHEDVEPDKPVVPKKLGKRVGYVANCNAVRLRAGANIRTSILATMPKGTKLDVNLDNSTTSFYEVTHEGMIGYTMKQFVDIG